MSSRRLNDAVLVKTTDSVEEIQVLSAVDGTARVYLASDDTANLPEDVYNHELKFVDGDGNVETLLTGKLTVKTSILD